MISDLVQKNFIVGDLEGNYNKIMQYYLASTGDLVIFSELSIIGYPPEDLLLLPHFLEEVQHFQNKLIEQSTNKGLLFGSIEHTTEGLYNVVVFAQYGKVQKIIRKKYLPNYGVFDEKRYFLAGDTINYIEFLGQKILILICEDLWQVNNNEIVENIDLIIAINASPFALGKNQERLKIASNLAKNFNSELIYVNCVGGQDSLVFDGGSFILNKKGKIIKNLEFFAEDSFLFNRKNNLLKEIEFSYSDEELAYNALLLSVRDYVEKNKQQSILIGLSGGADSAFCAILCADALGVENINLVMMPSRYTSKESFSDADELIKNLKAENILTLAIENIFVSFEEQLAEAFKGKEKDLTEENLQARIRGGLLMALSNKLGHLVIATSNKSEAAVGYATLYGDMCGAFSPIKDVYKSFLYKLCHWRNNNIPAISRAKIANPIPHNIIEKAPTAELRDEQKDSDSLPEYEILDEVLFNLIEEKKSVAEIVSLGFSKDVVEKVAKLLKFSEYKRYQAAIGPKISNLSFDKERRFPIVNGFL